MLIWVVGLCCVVAFSAAMFVAAAIVWLRKLRSTVSGTLAEAATHQVHNAQKLSEAMAQMQKQQRAYETQLYNLAQASLKLRQELTSVAYRLEHSDADGQRTVH